MKSIYKFITLLLLLLSLTFPPSPAAADTALPPETSADTPQSTLQHPTIPDLISNDSLAPLVFHYHPKYQESLASLLSQASDIRDKVLNDFPNAPLPNIHIYLLPEIERYFTSLNQPARSPHWASGLALLSQNVILIRLNVAVPGGKLELDRTLGHELSHVILHHMSHNQPLPHWFIEGLAMYQTEPWTIERSQPLTDALKLGKLLPLSQFSERFPADHLTAQLAYAESAHFFFWLDQQFGKQAIRDILSGLHNRLSLRASIEAATGQPLWSLEAQWQESLAIDDTWLPIAIEAATAALTLLALSSILLFFLRRRRHNLAKIQTALQDPPTKIPPHLQHFSPFSEDNHHPHQSH